LFSLTLFTHEIVDLQVGSGPGNLTRAVLLAGAKHVIALEKDHRFIPALEMLQKAAGGEEKMTIVQGCFYVLLFTLFTLSSLFFVGISLRVLISFALYFIGDALDVDEAVLLGAAGAAKASEWAGESKVHVVGNLPFAVSTELLLKWMRQIPSRTGLFEVIAEKTKYTLQICCFELIDCLFYMTEDLKWNLIVFVFSLVVWG
jgi:dimethyladenosine transferase 1